VKIIATMTVRNSAWCLGLTARAALMWCDAIVIRDHGSSDETPEIAYEVGKEFPGQVIYKRDDDPVWNEMAHRNDALNIAREHGATHIAIIDDDELLTGNLISDRCYSSELIADGEIPRIRAMVARMGSHNILTVPWLALKGSPTTYYTTGPWANNPVSLVFQDRPELHWSSEKRGGYDFHHREPMGIPLINYSPVHDPKHGGLMHLQFASERRLRAKQALYKMTEVLRWPGREPVSVVDQRYNLAVYGTAIPGTAGHRRRAGEGNGLQVSDTPAEWWEPYKNILKHLQVTRIPWQEQQCIELMKEHGPRTFEGLDLFGVV
jgi:hypothetical protein